MVQRDEQHMRLIPLRPAVEPEKRPLRQIERRFMGGGDLLRQCSLGPGAGVNRREQSREITMDHLVGQTINDPKGGAQCRVAVDQLLKGFLQRAPIQLRMDA